MESTAITEAERRSLGRFDTPRPLAQALSDWAVRDVSDSVLEPSCGGGVIVKSVIARFSELGLVNPSAQIWACDIDKRALAETRCNISPHAPKLVLRNFLDSTSLTFGGVKFKVILGNPPYVRLHTMDLATRKVARESLQEPNLLDAKASLWAYFPIHAFKMLAVGGRMGWILPEIVLHSEYGKQVLRWATQNFQRCIAVSLRERCFLADGAKERVVILLLEGAGHQAAREIEMIEFATASDCIKVLPRLAHPQSPNLPQLNGHAVPHLVSDFAAIAAHAMAGSADLKRLEDFADVKIGVVTGNNNFFLLTEEQRSAANLNVRHFRRVVAKFADLGEGFHFADKAIERNSKPSLDRAWLLCPNPTSVDTRLTKYLKLYPLPAPDKRLMLEESNLARWLGQLLKPHVQQLVVCDARRNHLISHDHHKHDRRDAFALARLLRLNEFKPVWQPTEPQRVLFKRCAQAYENAVQRQTRLKLQLKAMFQHWGLFPTGSTVFAKTGRNDWLKQLPYDALRAQAMIHYALLDQALASQVQCRRLLCQTGRPFPEVKRLRTVPGS